MKGPPIDQLVYNCMFPKPKPTDPQNFQGLLQRQLVPEVRLETQGFYGHLSSQEAKYPGLDYSFPPHRLRLSRFPWHRRLFRAFDNLGLTKSEIAGLTKWEGTRWAKERYEREQGVVIRDTTADGIDTWVPPELRPTPPPMIAREDVDDMEDIQEDAETDNEMDEGTDDSDPEIQSVGIELNERLRAAAAQREAGNTGTVMDEEWEQWLKDAVEAGGIPLLNTEGLSPNAHIPGTRPETSALHPRFLNAARSGQWQHIPNIPNILHNMVREAQSNRRRGEAPPTPISATSTATPSPSTSQSQPSLFSRSTPTSASTSTSATTLSPRARTPSTSPYPRIDPRTVARLHSHFAGQYSRRQVPSPQTETVNVSVNVNGRVGPTRTTLRLNIRPQQSQSQGGS